MDHIATAETIEEERRDDATAFAKAAMASLTSEAQANDIWILEILRNWGFRRNVRRKNVIPNGKRSVSSDTFGVVGSAHGSRISEVTRKYPEFCKAINTWVRNAMPEQWKSFTYTSISLNSSYAAKTHVDEGYAGPSFVRTIGKFDGGNLQIWTNSSKDDIPTLTSKQAHVFDIQNPLLFDGRLPHGVQDFTGERFSVVCYTASGADFKRKCTTLSAQLAGTGFPGSTRDTIHSNLALVPLGWAVPIGQVPAMYPKEQKTRSNAATDISGDKPAAQPTNQRQQRQKREAAKKRELDAAARADKKMRENYKKRGLQQTTLPTMDQKRAALMSTPALFGDKDQVQELKNINRTPNKTTKMPGDGQGILQGL